MSPGDVSINSPNRDGVRFTLDGTEPTIDSRRYTAPLKLDAETRLIRAAYFDPCGTGRSYDDAFVFDGHPCRIWAFIHAWQRSVLRHITRGGIRLTIDSNEPLSADDHATVTPLRPTSLG